MHISDARREWVLRVLDIDVGEPARDSSRSSVDIRAMWNDAKDEIDGKLNALARELREHDDEDLDQIAEFGLFGLTDGRETVGLMAALADYDRTPTAERDRVAAQVRTAIASLRTSLISNPVIELVDDNPFGIDVALQATLGGALDRIEGVLA